MRCLVLSNLDKFHLSQRETLHEDERKLISGTMHELGALSVVHGVPIALDDRIRSVEASLIRLVLNSREGV